jgi:two-component system cell cycle response regulator CtrA
LGADDYIRKPFHKDVLMARLLTVSRRRDGFSQQTFEIGNISLNQLTNDIRINGTSTHFTGKEYAILALLIRRAGTVVTKELIMDNCYGGRDEPDWKIVDIYICRLRKKLRAVGSSEHIENVWGRGYMLSNPKITRAHPSHTASYAGA